MLLQDIPDLLLLPREGIQWNTLGDSGLQHFLIEVLQKSFQEGVRREEASAIVSHTGPYEFFPVGPQKVLVNVDLAGGSEGAMRAAEGFFSRVREDMAVDVVLLAGAVATHIAYVRPLQLPRPVILTPLLRKTYLEEERKMYIYFCSGAFKATYIC